MVLLWLLSNLPICKKNCLTFTFYGYTSFTAAEAHLDSLWKDSHLFLHPRRGRYWRQVWAILPLSLTVVLFEYLRRLARKTCWMIHTDRRHQHQRWLSFIPWFNLTFYPDYLLTFSLLWLKFQMEKTWIYLNPSYALCLLHILTCTLLVFGCPPGIVKM